jgi:hypothetical protein
VFVTEEEAEFARAMMNLLSMDFDIHTRYADMLRFNSFRRARRVRRELGNGFIFATHGAKPCKDFDIGKLSDRARWVKEHGTTILDFGAGHLTETFLLRQAGIDCTPSRSTTATICWCRYARNARWPRSIILKEIVKASTEMLGLFYCK